MLAVTVIGLIWIRDGISEFSPGAEEIRLYSRNLVSSFVRPWRDWNRSHVLKTRRRGKATWSGSPFAYIL